jgi:hypothetical protein
MYVSRTTVAPDHATTRVSRVVSTETLPWVLRVGAFLCFVGHGAFGLITKPAWLPYFAVANIGPATAYRLMPLIGALDVTMGLLILFAPRAAVVYWMLVWAVWTALLRPLAGESVWEAVERAGNYGVPAALLVLMVPPRIAADAARPSTFRPITPDLLDQLRVVLSTVVAMLLIGHGALGLEQKPGLVSNYAALVPASTALTLTPIVGTLEIVFAIILLLRPSISLALLVAAWKLATESLFLVAGQPVWEFVERGGSYAAPVALAIAIWLRRRDATPDQTRLAS